MKPKKHLRAAAAFAFAAALLTGSLVPSASAALPATTTRKAITRKVSTLGRGVTTALKQTLTPLENFFSSKIPFGNVIVREAKKNGLAPELVAAVIKQESKFVPNARSPRGALGLMQLLPSTGRWMGAHNLLNPEQNIAAGTRYLKYLSDQFGGNETKVIAAYNAGEGNVRRFKGLPPFRETQTYVRNVRRFRDDLVRNAALGI